MTDTTQSKEIIQKYHRVFLNSLHFEMAREDEMKFMANQFDEIEDEIELALEFIGLPPKVVPIVKLVFVQTERNRAYDTQTVHS